MRGVRGACYSSPMQRTETTSPHAAFDAAQIGKRVECWSTTCPDAETGATGTITAHDYANGRMSVALDAGGTIETTVCLWAES